VASARERSGRKKRKLPKATARIAVFVLAFVAVLLLIIFSARACARSGEARAYATYMSEVQKIVAASDEVGTQLTQLLTNPGDTSRADVQAKLDGFVVQCQALENQSIKLEAPKALISSSVHQIFTLVMGFRSTGVDSLKTFLLGALEVEDSGTVTTMPTTTGDSATTTTTIGSVSTAGSVDQIMNSLRFLTTSDFLYKEVFEKRAAQILTENGIGGVVAPASQFINDPEIASSGKVRSIVSAMRTTGNLQAVHGVALASVMVQPDGKTIVQGGTYNLTQTEGLAFVVTVENQGNMDEQEVPVKITLVSKSSEQQEVTVKVPAMKAKSTEVATVTGLNPTTYGETATLTITVGPLRDERFTTNNTLTATLIFKL
jgi:low affinity Fe/Cu permease